MKNVTISMDEATAAWARVEAAKAGKSLSRFVGDILASQIEQKSSQSETLKRLLAFPKLDLTDENGNAPTRNDIYDDDILRGHQHPDLRAGREATREGENRAPMAR